MKLHVIALIAISIASLALVGSYVYVDDIHLLFNSWLEGKPKAMNKLIIHVPSPPNAYKCFVIVKRFPTPLEPTKNGRSELLYKGVVSPGKVVVVKHIFDAVPVSFKAVSNEHRVLYYEPKEYFIGILCIDKDKHTVFRFGKIYQVVPRKLINEVDIWPRAKASLSSLEMPKLSGIAEESSSPDYVSECTWYDVDECIAWIAFTYVNSIPGIKASFGILGGPIPSAVYIEAFSRTYTDVEASMGEIPPFDSAGKKLVSSDVTEKTDYVCDGRRGKVLLDVVFRDEQDWFCDNFVGLCVCFETFYPVEVGGIKLDSNYSGWYSQPSSPPLYATGPIHGDITIWFAKPNEVIETDEVTGVRTSLTVYGSVTVTVDIYKAVRYDSEYTTPYVEIKDVSGKTYDWYYWWYRDNDKKTYEVLLYGK